MKLVGVQFVCWDSKYYIKIDNPDFKVGDKILVKAEWGREIGKVDSIEDFAKDFSGEYVEYIGKPTEDDNNRLKEIYIAEKGALEYCHELVKKYALSMKLIDAHFSFDKEKLIFSFIAQGRVDFRNLLKDLTKRYHGNIRLEQIGVRDEAKINGDIGDCGCALCCQGHLKFLGKVSADMAQTQNIAHRGVDRLSGICGRLKCCLAYENEQYDELNKKIPRIGTKIKIPEGSGKVISRYFLQNAVDVKLDSEGNKIIRHILK